MSSLGRGPCTRDLTSFNLMASRDKHMVDDRRQARNLGCDSPLGRLLIGAAGKFGQHSGRASNDRRLSYCKSCRGPELRQRARLDMEEWATATKDSSKDKIYRITKSAAELGTVAVHTECHYRLEPKPTYSRNKRPSTSFHFHIPKTAYDCP
jgi:hypothetical protein